MRKFVDRIALGDLREFLALRGHKGKTGPAVPLSQHKSNLVVAGQGADLRNSVIGAVEDALLEIVAFPQDENSGNVRSIQGVEQLAFPAARRKTIHCYGHFTRVPGLHPPGRPTAHELSAPAFGLPGVTPLNLLGPLSNAFAELALDQLRRHRVPFCV